jgi:hypothetical protein
MHKKMLLPRELAAMAMTTTRIMTVLIRRRALRLETQLKTMKMVKMVPKTMKHRARYVEFRP